MRSVLVNGVAWVGCSGCEGLDVLMRMAVSVVALSFLEGYALLCRLLFRV
jgi:hypothetical protein